MRERNLTFTQTLIFFACIFLLGLVIGLLFTSVDGLTNEDVCNRLYPNGTYAEVNSCILFFGSLNETVIQTNNMTQVYNMTNNITETVTNNITTTVLRSMDADFTEYYDKSQMDNKFSTLTVDIKDWTRDELREIQVTSPDSGSDIDNILKYPVTSVEAVRKRGYRGFRRWRFQLWRMVWSCTVGGKSFVTTRGNCAAGFARTQ